MQKGCTVKVAATTEYHSQLPFLHFSCLGRLFGQLSSQGADALSALEKIII